MPIRFRCGYCNRLLAIARRKAGNETTCPHCGYTLTVPDDTAEAPAESGQFEDLDSLMNPFSTPETASDSSSRPPEPRSSCPRPTDSPAARRPSNSEEQSGYDKYSGLLLVPYQPATQSVAGTSLPATPQPAAGDRNPLNDRSQIVMSVQLATGLVILAIILIGLSFAAGFLVASSR